MVSQIENANNVMVKVGDVFKCSRRFTSFRVINVDNTSVNMNCDSYWNLGELTLSIFETFNNLRKSCGVESCNFVMKNYGTIRIDSSVSEQSVYSKLIERISL